MECISLTKILYSVILKPFSTLGSAAPFVCACLCSRRSSFLVRETALECKQHSRRYGSSSCLCRYREQLGSSVGRIGGSVECRGAREGGGVRNICQPRQNYHPCISNSSQYFVSRYSIRLTMQCW